MLSLSLCFRNILSTTTVVFTAFEGQSHYFKMVLNEVLFLWATLYVVHSASGTRRVMMQMSPTCQRRELGEMGQDSPLKLTDLKMT